MRFVLLVKDLIIIWLMASLLNMSGRLLNFRPYDAEVEYLRSTGTQYINTGVILQRADLCRMDIVCTFYKGGISNCNGLSGYVYRGPHVGIGSTNTFFYCANYRDSNYDTYTDTAALLGVPYHYKLDIKNSTLIIEDYINDTEVYHTDNIRKSQNSPQRTVPMILFGYYSTAVAARATEIYKATIYEDDVLLRDFIPVRVGQVGYMYDKVTGQLFGNAGTGSFILGPDKTN